MNFKEFEKDLLHKNMQGLALNKTTTIRAGEKAIECLIVQTPQLESGFKGIQIPLDYLHTMPEKILSMLGSKLGMNATVFARNCRVIKVERPEAEAFLNKYHVMGATQSGFNSGLYYKNELVALASFSKGRKMNRLREDQRSYEMIRFCCKSGITVTGGLTKLVKNFCIDKNAGDIMTYVDKQFSEGTSFIKSGFKFHSEKEPNYFLVDKITYQRISLKNAEEIVDSKKFYLTHNCGNIKLVYTPAEI
ncbi:MAG: hypothetical protein IT236_04755 [Bacteroidia bacterium]|nr:hypothetical protein [Bacteroidia bacterium]